MERSNSAERVVRSENNNNDTSLDVSPLFANASRRDATAIRYVRMLYKSELANHANSDGIARSRSRFVAALAQPFASVARSAAAALLRVVLTGVLAGREVEDLNDVIHALHLLGV